MYTEQCALYIVHVYCTLYTVQEYNEQCILYIEHVYCALYTVEQGSPTYGPRAKYGPFQKNDGPF